MADLALLKRETIEVAAILRHQSRDEGGRQTGLKLCAREIVAMQS
jgi:hypothetical protein